MKKKWLLSFVLLMVVVSLAACGGNSAVVKTDAGNVTKDDLYEAMKDKAGNQTVYMLTINKILSKNHKVSDKEVNAKFNETKAQYGDQFESALQQANFTDSSYKMNIKNQLLTQKAAKSSMKISDKDLKTFYKTWKPKVTVNQILVADKKTADKVEKELKSGGKFADLAKKYSTDKATKNKGGKLAPFGPNQMDPAFEKAAFALKNKGDLSSPVKTQYGYHIIQLEKPAKKTTFEKDKPTVKADYIDSKLNDNTFIQSVVKKEFKKANVKVEDKGLKDAFTQLTAKSK